MKKLLALIIPVALVMSSPAAVPLLQEPYEPCPHQGWPGGYHPYCVDEDNTLVVKTWVIPSEPPEALYESLCAEPEAYGRRYALQPVWYNIQTGELLTMPEGERWEFQATAEEPCETRRWPVAWPGDGWGPDLLVVDGDPVFTTWLPLVEG